MSKQSATVAVPTDTDVLKPEQAAALLQLPPRQLQRLRVPCRIIGHKTIRYSRAEILAWLASRPTTRPKIKRSKKGR